MRFQPSLSGTLSLSRTNAFFLGGGKALVNAYYRTASLLGVEFVYNAQVRHLELDGRRIAWVDAVLGGEMQKFTPRSVVVASGGFQADIDWLEEAWGPAARNFLIRGTPYNRGVVLRDLLDQGILPVGDPSQCHAVAIDGRAPKFDGGIVTRLDCIPFSVVLNNRGQRFCDEGEDLWPKRYAIWGRLVADQPDQVGYAIFDSKSIDLFMPSVFPPHQADEVSGLARKMGLPEDATRSTVNDYNAACRPGSFHPAKLSTAWEHEGLNRPNPIGPARFAILHSLATSCGPVLPSPISDCAWTRTRRCRQAAGQSKTCGPRAKSWPVRSWERGILQVSA